MGPQVVSYSAGEIREGIYQDMPGCSWACCQFSGMVNYICTMLSVTH